MSERRGLLAAIILPVLVFTAVLAFVARGATGTPDKPVLSSSIGLVDSAVLKEKMPDAAQLKERKVVYDAELNAYAAEQRQAAAAYYASLEQKKEQELVGKTEAEKKAIEEKYDKLARDKATEINKAIQAKMTELQDKFDVEVAQAEDRLRQAVATVAAAKGLVLVLGESAVYHGGVDITEEVVAKATSQTKGGETKK